MLDFLRCLATFEVLLLRPFDFLFCERSSLLFASCRASYLAIPEKLKSGQQSLYVYNTTDNIILNNTKNIPKRITPQPTFHGIPARVPTKHTEVQVHMVEGKMSKRSETATGTRTFFGQKS